MKEAIKGYLTGMINNHQRIVDSLIKFNYSEMQINTHKNVTNELNDLLDFVEDLPECNNKDNELLRKRIRELEDACENFVEVEKNQRKKIDDLTMQLAAEISAHEIFGGAKHE